MMMMHNSASVTAAWSPTFAAWIGVPSNVLDDRFRSKPQVGMEWSDGSLLNHLNNYPEPPPLATQVNTDDIPKVSYNPPVTVVYPNRYTNVL